MAKFSTIRSLALGAALALGAPPKSLEEEIAELRNEEAVDAELEALKAKLNSGKEG